MRTQRKLRVLCIEDDPSLGRIVEKRLERLGHTITLAPSGEAGLAALDGDHFDVMALDYSLPGMSGIDLLRTLDGRGSAPPVVMVTGQGDETVAVEAMKLGASDYVVKDVQGEYVDLLAGTLERACRHRELEEARTLARNRLERLNRLSDGLLASGTLANKMSQVTDCVVQLLEADFARIWLTAPGDLCDSGCVHHRGADGPHVCRQPDRCLHLIASSGRYTHIDGEVHSRVPFGCYKIGRIAAGTDVRFLTNDVTRDPSIHDHDWAREHDLVSFAGYSLVSADNLPVGVLALFSQRALSPDDDVLLRTLANTTAEVIRGANAERDLRASEERFRAIADYTYDWESWFAADGRLRWVNPAVEKLTGRSMAECLEMSDYPLSIVYEEDREQFGKRLQRAISDQNSTNDRDFRILHKDGSIRWMTISWQPIYDALDQYIGQRTSVRDITERKRLEEEGLEMERRLQHAQKLESLGVLAGGIAHDFNNILMAVLGYADLALRDLVVTHPARSKVQEIEKAAKRAANLTRQMLAYSGKGNFVVVPMDLSTLIEDMAHLLRTTIPKTIPLNLHLDRSLPNIEGDVAQLQQVVMNLITNAAEAVGDEGGFVALSTGNLECTEEYLADSLIPITSAEDLLPPGPYVYLQVTDTGCGIDDETRARIFEPFFTTKFTGRGLGMAATLGIVRAHKCALLLDTELGRGSTFRLLFPVIEGQRAVFAGKKPVASAANCPSTRGTVLVVDDEESVRKVMTVMLHRLGFEVLTAVNGYEGVEVFRRHSGDIDCVILDLTMPRMDGAACFQALRQIEDDVKAILVSGYAEDELSRRFAGQGLAGFIQKPFGLAALEERLREILPATVWPG